MNICVVQNSSLKSTKSAMVEVEKAAKALGLKLVPESAAEKADLILVLGGDGSVLHAVRTYGRLEIPFLNINIGSLGYLTCTDIDGMQEALCAFRDGDCAIEERSLLRAQIRRQGRGRALTAEYALNEFTLTRGDSGHTVGIDLKVDGNEVTTFLCDGLILATPTGSTAYSLSAGGPILMPSTPAYIINVICPHALTSRPLVVPCETVVELRVAKAPAPLVLSVDGEDRGRLKPGDTLTATTAALTVKLLTLPFHDPFAALCHKLGWRGSTLNSLK